MPSDRDATAYSDPRRGERLQRVLADAGIAARRLCERIIEEGRVSVNGQRLTRLPIFVNPHSDSISVDGRPLPKPQRLIYVMLNKPTKTLSTIGDNQGDRNNAVSLIDHPAKPRLFPVGGLDFDTSGLMLFTNDGELANHLTHPRYQTTKLYHANLRAGATPAALSTLRRGVYVLADEEPAGPSRGTDAPPARRPGARDEGKGAKPRRVPARDGQFKRENERPSRLIKLDARLLPQDPTGKTLEISATIARDVEIAKALHLVGLSVKRLERVAIGNLWLKGLASGQWRELERKEVQALKRSGVRPGARFAPGLRGTSKSARERTNAVTPQGTPAPAKVSDRDRSIPTIEPGTRQSQEAVTPAGNPLIRRRRKVADDEIDL